MSIVDTIRHGTRAGYSAGCRCDECRAATARYERGRQWDILRGQQRTVPTIGARRRIEALQALGWSAEALSRRLGFSRAWLNMTLRCERIYRRNHDLIAALYDDLSMTLPPQTKCTDRQRAYARKKGWAVPLAWNDETIDDPTARPHGTREARSRHDLDPVVVERVLAGDRDQPVTRAERHEVIRRWPGSIGALERLRPDWNVARDLREMRAGVGVAS